MHSRLHCGGGDVCFWILRGCLPLDPRGVSGPLSSGGSCLPLDWGVSAPLGLGECLPLGPGCLHTHTHTPCEQNESQTDVKTLPFRNFVGKIAVRTQNHKLRYQPLSPSHIRIASEALNTLNIHQLTSLAMSNYTKLPNLGKELEYTPQLQKCRKTSPTNSVSMDMECM